MRRNNANWRANAKEPRHAKSYTVSLRIQRPNTKNTHANSPRKYDRDGSIDRGAGRIAALDLLDGHDYPLPYVGRDEHERPFFYPGHPRLAIGLRLRVLRGLSWHKHGVLRWRLLSRHKVRSPGWGGPRFGEERLCGGPGPKCVVTVEGQTCEKNLAGATGAWRARQKSKPAATMPYQT